MFLRILGSVEVLVEKRWCRAGPAKQAAILAALAVSPRRSVPQSALILRAWGSEPPPSSRSALYSYVARLRRLIATVPDASIQRGAGNGYRLEVDDGAIDLFVMRDLAAKASSLHDIGDIGGAVDCWRRAVALWRDRPLAHIETAWADRVRAALTREHVANLRNLYAAELDAGGHGAVIGELTEAVVAYPREEPLIAELMRAVFLSGRQADALALYSETVARLRDEFGVEPSARLRRMQRRILRQDPNLQPESALSSPSPSPMMPTAAHPTGRDGPMRELDALFADSRDDTVQIVLVTGEAGVGKTTLALNWAHRIVDDFPDGRLFEHLHGDRSVDTTSDVLARLLTALGVTGPSIPADVDDRLALYRSRTANRRLLLVLDDVADPDVVRTLTPTGAGSLVVVTSRHALSGLLALQDARRVTVPGLSRADSMGLLAALLGERATAEPTAADRLVTVCAGFPLALELACAGLDDDERLCDYVDALGFRHDDPVRAVFDHVFSRLDERARTVFGCLGSVPGSSAPGRAVACMAAMDSADADVALRTLEEARLIVKTAPDSYAVRGRLCDYAAEWFDELETSDAQSRLFDWYVHSARRASEAISAGGLQLPAPAVTAGVDVPTFSSGEAAITWFRNEVDNLVAAIRRAVAVENAAAWLLVDAMRLYLERGMDRPVHSELIELGLKAATTAGEHDATVVLRTTLARRIKFLGDPAGAEKLLLAALADTRRDALRSTIQLDLAELYYRSGRLDEAVRRAEEALAVPDPTDRHRMIGVNVLGSIHRERGDTATSRRLLEQLVDTLTGPKLAPALWNLAVTCRETGDLAAATEHAQRALQYAAAHRMSKSYVLDVLARIHIERGDVVAARAHAVESYEHLQKGTSELYVPRAMVTLAWCTGDAEEADGLASAAARYARETSLAQIETDAHLVGAHARLALKRPGDALTSAETALRLADRYGYRLLHARAVFVRGRIHRNRGDVDRALRDVRSAETEFAACGDRVGKARAVHLGAVMSGDDRLAEKANAVLSECGAARVHTDEEKTRR